MIIDFPEDREQPTILVVDWIDSSLQNGQVGKSEYPDPEVIRSVGWLVSDGPDAVVLARDDMKDDEYRGLIAIPGVCIRSRSDEGEKSKTKP